MSQCKICDFKNIMIKKRENIQWNLNFDLSRGMSGKRSLSAFDTLPWWYDNTFPALYSIIIIKIMKDNKENK